LWKVLRPQFLGPVEEFGTHCVKSQFAVRGRDFNLITASCTGNLLHLESSIIFTSWIIFCVLGAFLFKHVTPC